MVKKESLLGRKGWCLQFGNFFLNIGIKILFTETFQLSCNAPIEGWHFAQYGNTLQLFEYTNKLCISF